VTHVRRRGILWAGGIVVAVAVTVAAGRGGGGIGAGGRTGGGGGYNRGGVAAGGSFGQGRVAGGGFSARGPAASGSFAGRQPSAGTAAGGSLGGRQQADSEALAQGQSERFGRLGPPAGGVDVQRRAQGDAHQQYAGSRREDWQDYANDHSDEHDDYPGTATAVAVGAAVGAAVGVAATAPAYWTLSCMPTTVVVGGTTYYQCGSAWYVRVYSGGDVAYTMVNPPAGY
jgi:hypothetical protein